MKLRKVLFIIIIVLIVITNVIATFPIVITAPIALLLGVIFTNSMGNPYATRSSKWTKKLLQYAIIGLGFGINASEAMSASSDGLWLTVVTILFALIVGGMMARWLVVKRNTGTLISMGTAICGGSAIAAIAPIIQADDEENGLALGTVFTLNAVALFIFPAIGHLLEMSQYQFGIWSAVAIHDTSSVVGAASKYGDEALKVATTVKLARALWIIPLAFIFGQWNRKSGVKVSIPYFIMWFIVAIAINSLMPEIRSFSSMIVTIAKSMMVVTLFLIGNSLTLGLMKKVGLRPLILGILLWIMIASGSLYYVMNLL